MGDSFKQSYFEMINDKILNRKDLKYYIHEDAVANEMDCSYLKYLFLLLCGIEKAYVCRYLKLFRKAEYHSNNEGIYHRILYGYYSLRFHRLGFKYHIQMKMNRIGYGLRILHLSGGGGVLLNVERVGNYCDFNAGVLIGNNGDNRKPIIGDHVKFGSGSSAFGNIKIGSHVFVAPGAVVRKDVPDNCVVGGVPARVIKFSGYFRL